MVGVRVAEDDEVEPPSGRPQPAVRPLVAATVDEERRPGGLDEDRVALADVDGRHRELANRDERGGERQRGDGEARGRDQPGAPASASAAGQQPPPAGSGRDDADRTCRLDRDAVAVECACRAEHDRERRAGHGEERGGGAGGDGPDECRRRGDRRGDRRRGNRDHVRGDGDQRNVTERAQQQRSDRKLRPERRGQEGCRPLRQPGEAAADVRGDHQHPEGGGRRQQQPRRRGCTRVEQAHQQNRPGQGVTGVPQVTAPHRQQNQPGHDRRTDDARLPPGEEREPGDGHGHHPATSPRPDGQCTQ